MSDCSQNRNPLSRSGTNRKERVLPAMDANYILPDEHSFAEWLVYARNLGDYIKYYDLNSPNGDKQNWQPFFDADTSAQLALIAVQNVNGYKERVRDLLDTLKTEGTDPVVLKQAFGQLYSAVFSMAYRFDYFCKILPNTLPLKNSINNLIRGKLSFGLYRLLSYYRAAYKYNPSLVVESKQDGWSILGYKQETAADILALGFSDKWENWDDGNDENIIYNRDYGLVPDGDVWEILNHVANHNLFTGIFSEFLSAYARVVSEAKKQLIDTIINQNTHEPHYALFLAFLHLFKHAQTGLNTYTHRHLDFYYKEILQLSPSKSSPNSVHVLFELANFVDEYLVTKGTVLKAGKDSLGKEVIYKTDEDIIVNKAAVSELRSFFRAIASDTIGGSSLKGNIYISPVANSADGIGGKSETEEGDWHPFVNKTYTDGLLTDIDMPLANIGFAVASHQLSLAEGKRIITITWKGSSLNTLNGRKFDCYLTTEKGWLLKEVTLSGSNSSATAVINIDATEPAITPYIAKAHVDKEMHQHTFRNADTPVAKFFLRNMAPADQYEALKDINILSIDVEVEVGTMTGQYNTDGVRRLQIATDTGVVDPSKPFIPFGQTPKKGAGLVIGSEEVFSKPKTLFKLYIEWAELIGSIKDMDVNLVNEFFPSAQLKFLVGGVWEDAQFKSILNSENVGQDFGEVELFWGANSVMMSQVYLPSPISNNPPPYIPEDAVLDYKDEYDPYNITSRNGFMKLQLNADFQWDLYFKQVQIYLINKALEKSDNPEPKQPYLPKIQAISMSYKSVETISFEDSENSMYYHLYPFGNDVVDSTQKVSGKVKLMPQFVHNCNDAPLGYMHNQAEFYIGLTDVVPAQKINLLFKVLDGSTDPRQTKPKYHVNWSYLGNNAWTDFDTTEVNDTTQQLISTGIISFSMPEEATNDNTILPSGYHWIKAGINGLPEGVCRLISVSAQAVQATFYDQGNASDFLSQPLAAGTVAKLQLADANIKKIEQPYSSFGGRYQEDDQSFYTRVSERLRHKQRAITMRDIEQLVLEKFEDIHKVKCLNHTRPLIEESTEVEEKCNDIPVPIADGAVINYNEQAPGHVTVITIPDLRNKNAVNPLRPYTSTDRLKDIEDYLMKLANCNVKWYIRNPEFEEVRIETNVILTDAVAGNDAYYSAQLKEDIIKYLTPWAYNVNTDIKFGGKLAKSSIINFIERLSYIDVILDLKMYRGTGNTPLDEVVAESWEILVAAATAKHKVTIIKKTEKAVDSECE